MNLFSQAAIIRLCYSLFSDPIVAVQNQQLLHGHLLSRPNSTRTSVTTSPYPGAESAPHLPLPTTAVLYNLPLHLPPAYSGSSPKIQ